MASTTHLDILQNWEFKQQWGDPHGCSIHTLQFIPQLDHVMITGIFPVYGLFFREIHRWSVDSYKKTSMQSLVIFFVVIPKKLSNRKSYCRWFQTSCRSCDVIPDNKVHGYNMGPTWVLSTPDGPHVGPMNLAIRDGNHTLSSRWKIPLFPFRHNWVRLHKYVTQWRQGKHCQLLRQMVPELPFSCKKAVNFRLFFAFLFVLVIQLTREFSWFGLWRDLTCQCIFRKWWI